jgi:hypothetical protein
MSLFQLQDFIMHSGEPSYFKIECDYLTDMDIATFARIISEKVKFGSVYGIPRGGVKLEQALIPYITEGPHLIVDDVLTAGTSMEEAYKKARSYFNITGEIIGVVLFARKEPANWIKPIFQMW